MDLKQKMDTYIIIIINNIHILIKIRTFIEIGVLSYKYMWVLFLLKFVEINLTTKFILGIYTKIEI